MEKWKFLNFSAFFLFLFLLPNVNALVTVQGYVFNSDGTTQVPNGIDVAVHNLNSDAIVRIQTAGPPGHTGFYSTTIDANPGNTLRVTSYNNTNFGDNESIVSTDPETIRMNITLSNDILNVNLPLENSSIFNALTDTINVTTNDYAPHNQSFWLTLNNGKINTTFCSSGNCHNIQTSYTFRTQGFFNLTVYVNDSSNNILSKTIKNLFVTNLSTIVINSTYNGADIFCTETTSCSSYITDPSFREYGSVGISQDKNAYFFANFSSIPSNHLIYNSTFTAKRYSGLGESVIGIFNVTSEWNDSSSTDPSIDSTHLFNLTIPDVDNIFYTWNNLNSLISTWVINSSKNFGISLRHLSGDDPSLHNFIFSEDSTNSDRPYFNITHYSSNEAPTFSVTNPTNNSAWSVSNISVSVVITDVDEDTNIRVETWLNETLSNLNNVDSCNCSYNISFVDDGESVIFNFTNLNTGIYYWTMKADDGTTNGTLGIYKFTVSLTSPAISLNYPTDNSYSSNTSVTFNATATDPDGIKNFILYHNINGSFSANETNQSAVTSGISFTWSRIDNIPDGTYIWNAFSEDLSANGGFAFDNNTFTIDTIYPIVTLLSPMTTQGSQTVRFNHTASDINLASCKYNVLNSVGGIEIANTSTTCNENNTQFVVSDYATYTLNFYALDLAGNENSTSQSFTTVASGGTTGGGGTIIPTTGILQYLLAQNYSIATTSYGNVLDLVLAKDSVKPRTREFLLINKETEPIEVELVCDTTLLNESELSEGNYTTNINICDYIYFEKNLITISPNELEPTIAKVYIYTPDNAEFGDKYLYNILAVRDVGGEEQLFSKLSVRNRVPWWGLIFKWSAFPGQDEKPTEEKSAYPVFWVALIFSIIEFVFIVSIFTFLSRKEKRLPVFGFFSGLFVMLISLGLLLFYL